ncbi:histidine kinase [Oscillatoriales cyanobacterium USR001]|nr:histidine kinase [Oscillatoriales cyanobacterium USR001]
MQSPNPDEFININPEALINLENCNDELVYAPGFIQPHGVLLMLQEPDLKILQVSKNVEHFFGISAENLLDRPLEILFPFDQVQRIRRYFTQENIEFYNSFEIEISSDIIREIQDCHNERSFRGKIYRTTDGLMLEIEPKTVSENIYSLQFYERIQSSITNLRKAQNLMDLAQILAQEVKKITGFNRVMIYRFEADQSGLVIAEAKESHLETYLGLHYPKTDIPAASRKLFSCRFLRCIPNVNYVPSPLIPTNYPPTNKPLDLSDSMLRGVVSSHIEYLQNMGVAGSMTISLVNGKNLWGLIACHHYTPKLADYEIRKTCEFLGQFASIEMVHQQQEELNIYRVKVKVIQDELQKTLLQEPNFIEQVLTQNTSLLLNLVNSQGSAIMLDDHLTLVGQTPSEEQVRSLVSWLRQHSEERVFATNTLSRLYPEAKHFKDRASGMLAISIRLSHVKQKSYHILWFRPEQIQTVNWAGNPMNTVTINEIGEMKLSPRKSFAIWKETVKEMSLPWESAELEAANEMRNTFMLAVLEFSQKTLEQVAERAAIANLAKSQFLAKMSHELRTPLNAILGFTQLMIRDDRMPFEFHEHLGIIGRSGEHLLMLINDVLEMSKIEAGKLMLSEHCFNLFQFIYSINEMVALKASEKGLTIKIEQIGTVPSYVCGDEAKLRQILINLLSNAIKFTSTGGITLRISVKENINLRSPESSIDPLSNYPTNSFSGTPQILRLEVEDTGCGIASSDLESIFEAFMQTDRGRNAQGTGLGLSISRQFASLMGGDITVNSTLNQGSTFICEVNVTIPNSIDTMEEEVIQQVISLAPEQPTYRILVAEDVPENRQLLLMLLESVGFEMRAVENGAEAIAQWQEWHPHLILMDIEMPVINGYEAIRKIRANPTGNEVVIIAITAFAFNEDRIASLEVGCNDYIAKPFTENVLFNKIAHHLGVQYCYAEKPHKVQDFMTKQPQNLSLQELQIMPLEWVAQLHDAAMDLNEEKLHKLIAIIPEQEKLLIDKLIFLVDNFQFETIITLIENQ